MGLLLQLSLVWLKYVWDQACSWLLSRFGQVDIITTNEHSHMRN
uniref:Uncharacterized protein n=1 Tax=Anguilla anguilla TaxID=7936 RepID=A0A0E9SRZ5_ANGAN